MNRISLLALALVAMAVPDARADEAAIAAPAEATVEALDVRATTMPSPGGTGKPLAQVVDTPNFSLVVRGFGQLYVSPYAGKDALLPAGDAVEFAGFRVRRLQFGFEGKGPANLSFGIWTDLASSPSLLQAWLAWAPRAEFAVEAGVVRVPFSRSALQSSAEITFSERPLSVDRILPDRQPGIAVYGAIRGGLLTYRVGWFNGAPPERVGQGPDHTAGLVAGRLTFAPFGALRPGQSDVSRGPLRAELAMSAMQNFAAEFTSTTLGADLALQVRGASLLVEYVRDSRSPVSNPVTAPTIEGKIVRTGLIAQAAYQLWGPLEVAVRGELVDDNDQLEDVGDVLAGAAGVHATFPNVKVGLDWYHRIERFGSDLSNNVALGTVQGRF